MISQVITWSTLDGGCTEFSLVLKLIKENGDLETKWGLIGDPKSEKGPMGTHVGAVDLFKLTAWQYNSFHCLTGVETHF